MATITRFGFCRHLRADPNMFVMHYANGRLKRSGRGLAYFFMPLSAGIAEVPLMDNEITFAVSDHLKDYQAVTVQGVITYRIRDPQKAASALSFSIDIARGAYLQQPIEKLANWLSQVALGGTRTYLATATLEQALTTGAEPIRAAVEAALAAETGLASAGVGITSVRVLAVRASAEMEKALQTPTREQIQQRADEATFQRRALAVEKERAIKENELSTQIELARRNEDLLRRQGENELLASRSAAAAARVASEGEAERLAIAGRSAADDTRVRAEGQAAALRLVSAAEAEGESARAALYAGQPRHVLTGLALLQLSQKLGAIHHLNVTPDLAAELFGDLLRKQAG